MCHQTVSLVQVELERRGIATAALTMLPDITRRLAPPRALAVTAPLGSPVGLPHDSERHLLVLQRMLALVTRTDTPLLATF